MTLPKPSVRHRLSSIGAMLCLISPVALAQNAPATSDQPAAGESVVQMSQFEVTTTQGHGYFAPTSAEAFKTNESLIDIPQQVQVVTKDFIDELNTSDTSAVLRYFGVAAKFTGDTMQMRGSAVQVQPYVDDVPTHQYYSDSSIYDSYEIIKGPAQAFYLGAGVGGLILGTTKKPLPFEQNIFTASIDSWGFHRNTIDSTGPLGKIGESAIGYRVVGSYQDGKSYFVGNRNFRESIFPEFNVKYRDTTVRVFYEYEKTIAQQGMGLLTPQGQLYTGSGWKNSDNRTEDYAPAWEMTTVMGEWLQKLSDNWETRMTGMYWHHHVYGKYFSPTAANFDNDTETWIDRIGNERHDYWTVLADAEGHYTVGPSTWEMPSRDIFGYNFSDWTDKQAYWQTTPFPYPNGPVGGKLVIPFGQTWGTPLAGTNAFQPPTSGSWGAYNTVIQDSIYWQHEMDIVPNWLTLIAAFTWANIDTEGVANWATVPYVATHTPGQQWVHRLGAVFHVTKDVSIYALDSTNFATPLGTLLENGSLAPNQVGTGNEVGVKWNLLGGRVSGETAWFKIVTTNSLNTIAGLLPNGLNYGAVIGTTTLEGIDGDVTFQVLPGWQIIGSWYAGHDVDPNNNPVTLSWNNSLAAFTRYDFSHESALKGLAIGGGLNRIGGRWVTPSGVLTYSGPGGVPNFIKLQTGTEVEAFVDYRINRHWLAEVRVDNILNEAYPMNFQSPLFVDPSMPTTFTFQVTLSY